MNTRITEFGLCFLLIQFLFSSILYAKDRIMVFEHYTTVEGLSQNDVNCIFQDSRGILWIGTDDGFSTFDGYAFTNYRMDTHDLSSNLIHKILEDEYGNIWIGTANAGVNRFDWKTETFTSFENTASSPNLFTSNHVSSMTLDGKGNLWFGNIKGLNCIDKASLNSNELEVKKYYHNPHNPESLTSSIINTLYCDKDGELWVGNRKGLQKFEEPKDGQRYGVFKTFLKSGENSVYAICKSEKGLYIAYFDGVFELVNSANPTLNKISNLKSNRMKLDSYGTVWAGTEDGLYLLRPSSENRDLEEVGHFKNNIYDEHSISKNLIKDIYEDRTGIIWIGTNGGGINKYNPRRKRFKHIKKSPENGSLSYNEIRAIFEDSDHNLWIGTEGGGISYLPNENNESLYTGYKNIDVSLDLKSQNIVYDFAEWRGKIIIGVGYPSKALAIPKGEVSRFEQNKQAYIFSPDINTNAVFSIEAEGDSLLWMGTYGGGLFRGHFYDGEIHWSNPQIVLENTGNENAEIVRKVITDSEGNVWVGTDKGLALIKESEKLKENPSIKLFRSNQGENSLSYDYVLPIFEASNGEVWVGTMGGGLNIVKLNGEQITFNYLSTKDGLPSNVIKSIEEDNYGNLWVGSNHGLSKINLKTRAVINYDVSDGLQDNEFGELAVLKRHDGTLLFGGVNGFNTFFPHEIVDDHTVGQLTFTNLRVLNKQIEVNESFDGRTILNKAISETDKISLTYAQNSFSVQFSNLHYGAPDKNRYKYKLEGFDKEWVYADAFQREAKYTNIPPGSYTLLVKGANGDNVWNPEVLSLKIEVMPPWWWTWWAMITYVVLFIAAAYFFSKYSLITARKKNQLELEKLEREKLEDLSQLKMQFFTNISHELRTPLTLINTPIERLIRKGSEISQEEKQKSYQLISNNVQRLIRMVDQLLDFRKVEQGKMKLQLSRGNWATFVSQVHQAFRELATHAKLDLECHIEDEPIYGYMDIDKLEKIFYNLLSNAIKFTPQGKVSISVREEEGWAKVVVKDTGIGIPLEKQVNLFDRFYQVQNLESAKNRGTGIGLAFTKSLVELHHGKITFESEPGVGTTFFIEIPLSGAIYQQDQLEQTTSPLHLSAVDIENHEEEEEEKVTKPKILVVDDNAAIRDMLKGILEENYIVYLAEDGEKGLSLAREKMPQLVVSDVMMPVMDGYELVQQMRDDDQLCHLPVVLLTAKSSKESKQKGYEYGVDAYVTKPFNTALLLARIHAIIENRSSQQKRFRTNFEIQPSEIAFTSIDERFINRLVKIVEENISDSEFTVEKLAMEYGATPLRLNQKLKALTGQTAKGFIRNIRLKRAAQMLKLGRYSVSDVTYEVGFNDLKYFRNCFKKEFGIPPSQFLKQEVKEEEENTLMEIE
ncbi:two-component regulator propeller domain-containing protein [Limibacter armeniacum]|uniref:two-component regulator propeller domain-containing protein n=1 Tax=Limibacter armeniacum TaxID=466084 RepID=UPI002FE554D0